MALENMDLERLDLEQREAVETTEGFVAQIG
jgi:hypothetical protein